MVHLQFYTNYIFEYESTLRLRIHESSMTSSQLCCGDAAPSPDRDQTVISRNDDKYESTIRFRTHESSMKSSQLCCGDAAPSPDRDQPVKARKDNAPKDLKFSRSPLRDR